MKQSFIKNLKNWNLGFSKVFLLFTSIFMFFSGFLFTDQMWEIPWWFALLYGWSGIVVPIKLGDILKKEK